MKVFTRDYRITGEYHPLWKSYFRGMDPCVLDIETTGLDRSRCRVILIGLLTYTDSGVRVTQFLAENHYEESKVLDAAMDFIEDNKIGYLITYNGAHFDIPFINARLDACFAGRTLDLYDFDLYRFIKCGTDLRSRLESLSQKSVENYYGILDDRGDTISGRESVMMFDQYVLTGNTTLEKVILTHNREDVLHLNRLMYLALADVDDMHSALASYGFPASGGRLSVRPRLSKQKKSLKITGTQLSDPVSCAYFPDADCPVKAQFNATSSSYEIDAPVGRLEDDYYIDASSLGFDLSDDPDCVNGYLILDPRTINLISGLLAEKYIDL
ncbi:MAG: hypothetical protein E7219_04415 [Clostridiales bacterium]|nr:hypothetical protein [Clostridiales bacterium]